MSPTRLPGQANALHLQALEGGAAEKRPAALRESLEQLAGELRQMRSRLGAVLRRVQRLAAEVKEGQIG